MFRIIMLAVTLGGLPLFLTDAYGNETNTLLHEQAIVFETMDGQKTDAFAGRLQVPENRSSSASRTIQLHYVRFPSTASKPGAPIIYLAGGPGGSGIMTARYPGFRYPLFMALRAHGDVIALDQRGTGESNDLPKCLSEIAVPLAARTSDDHLATLTGQAARQCISFWTEQGIDVTGYNTMESATDLNALRQALGAEKISLWGISYGSHLALASLKVMPNQIDKIVIASAEGLNQTVKLPSRTDAYFERIQTAINSQPGSAAIYPDISGMVRRVHKKLDRQPILLSIPDDSGQTRAFLFQRYHMQAIASGMIADPHRGVEPLLATYRSIDLLPVEQITSQLIRLVQRAGLAEPNFSFELMPLTMDIASGISPDRLTEVTEQGRDSLLGTMLNFPMTQLANHFPELDLGEQFRQAPISEVPTLLLTGTLDGRTYPEGQAEAVKGMKNLTQVTVVNAGHNLFMVSPEVTAVIHEFMRGQPVSKHKIIVPLPAAWKDLNQDRD